MLRFFVAAYFLIASFNCSSQLVIDSAVTSPSVCYNDGTLKIYVSGGNSPYTYLLSSGPALPNVTYPVFPDNNNLFTNLHSGTYTVLVTDNSGSSITTSVTISGNYQFPSLTYNLLRDTIVVYPSLGLPPYSFAVSQVSANGPFGNYQSSNEFNGLCNGTYFVRVLDSCGNFYTTSGVVIDIPHVAGYGMFSMTGGVNNIQVVVPATFGHPPFSYICISDNYIDSNSTGLFTVPSLCPDTVYVVDNCNDTAVVCVACDILVLNSFCSNFTDSTASITVSGGSVPYTYRYYELDDSSLTWNLILTQDSGQFTHLPYSDTNAEVMFEITDACGRRTSAGDVHLTFGVYNGCPFNGTVGVIAGDGTMGHITSISCLSCTPQQTLTEPQPLYFSNLDTGTYIISATDMCGETRVRSYYVPDSGGVEISATYGFSACNDVKVSVRSSDSVLLTTGVTFVLRNDANFDSITTNNTGTFNNLADGSYIVIISYGSCADVSVGFSVPYFTDYCVRPNFDSACMLYLTAVYSPMKLNENYYLVSDSGVTYYELPSSDSGKIHINVPPGNYTLLSDSGCSVPQDFSFNFNLLETHSTDCFNQGTVTLTSEIANFKMCQNPFPYFYTLENPVNVFIPDTAVSSNHYFLNLVPDTFIAKARLSFPSTCLLDSQLIVVSPRIVPYMAAQNGSVCGVAGTADISFNILNGIPPYFISIDGFPGITTSSSIGVLPNIPVGNYVMIISDTCGISTSLSVSVIDTCIACDTIVADFTVSDSVTCKGTTVLFHNIYTGGSYQWSINGIAFDSTVNTSFTFDSAGVQFLQCVVSRFLCRDTFSMLIHVLEAPKFNLGSDTSVCDDFMLFLSTGILSTQWSTGLTDSTIVISSPGLFSATANNLCGTFTDSININLLPCPSEIHVPDAFSPNGDGNNDFFTVFGKRIAEYEIQIYNRWGNLVYTSADETELNNLNRGWDGTYTGKAQSLGTFVYYIFAKGDDGKYFEEKGNLTLIR